MANTVLVNEIDEVRASGILPGLHVVHVKATHNVGASNPRLVPMPSKDGQTLQLGFYVDAGHTTVLTPVEAKLELTGFTRVCVQGETNEICEDVPQ